MTQSKSTANGEEVEYYIPGLVDVTSGQTLFGRAVRKLLSYL
jgi:hypothetical protein